ncbi:MAG: hypothetical protein ACO3JL_11060 [Myxococcota bacterium]
MCCFSGPVELVADTKIFARLTEGWQYLAYEMRFDAKAPVAMVLPVPTRPESPRLEFIDLAGVDGFFGRLDTAFAAKSRGRSDGLSFEDDRGVLEVVRVGAFDASFVPAKADFARIDKRFQLSDAVWQELTGYIDWSFAVFQFAELHEHSHPMAFRFETRAPGSFYFPTMHVHDGTVPAVALFDHALYAQGQPDEDGWERTTARAGEVLGELAQHESIQRLCELGAFVRRREVRGERPNEDVWVPLWQG